MSLSDSSGESQVCVCVNDAIERGKGADESPCRFHLPPLPWRCSGGKATKPEAQRKGKCLCESERGKESERERRKREEVVMVDYYY